MVFKIINNSNKKRNDSHNNESICKKKYVKTVTNFKLPFRVDLCFVDHKFVIEIDEDGHLYYENDETRQRLIENLGFTFIRINPDPDPDASFDLDSKVAKIYNCINGSSVKLAEKSLMEMFSRELLNYISSTSKPFKNVSCFIKNYCLHCKYEKATIKNKTDKNRKRPWNNVLFGV